MDRINQESFANVWRRHRLQAYPLAKNAGVPTTTVTLMISGEPVSREQALKVLNTLNNMTGREYTFDNVDIKLEEEVDGQQK
jgi:hypothetical protein